MGQGERACISLRDTAPFRVSSVGEQQVTPGETDAYVARRAAPADDTRAPGRLRWARSAAGKVPTKWFTGVLTVLFLGATAAFGGLAPVDAPAPVIPELTAGQEYRGELLALSVDRVALLDRLRGSGTNPKDGQRVLAVVLDVKNRWTAPVSSGDSVGDALRIETLGDQAPKLVRYDDATLLPWLQPGVPARLIASWTVEAAAFRDGDDVRLIVRDESLVVGQYFLEGSYWESPVTAAYITAPAKDNGAGGDG